MTPDRRKDDDAKELIKSAFKEASQEWLDEKFAQFGKWTVTGLMAVLFVWLIGIWISMHGGQIREIVGTAKVVTQ